MVLAFLLASATAATFLFRLAISLRSQLLWSAYLDTAHHFVRSRQVKSSRGTAGSERGQAGSCCGLIAGCLIIDSTRPRTMRGRCFWLRRYRVMGETCCSARNPRTSYAVAITLRQAGVDRGRVKTHAHFSKVGSDISQSKNAWPLVFPERVNR